MSHWDVWGWAAYAALVIAAGIIAADTGLRLAPALMALLPHFLHSTLWGFAPLFFVVAATAILLWRVFRESNKKKNWSDAYKPTRIENKTFRNEKVVLDGAHYSHCKFYSVTFVYNGTTPVNFEHNEIFGAFISSDDPSISGALAILVGLGFIRGGVELSSSGGPSTKISRPTWR